MVYRLSLKARSPQKLELSFGWGWRLFFLTVALVLVAAMVQDGRFSWFIFLIASLFGLAAFYTEQWTFDREQKVVEARQGLVFLAKRQVYPLDQLEAVVFRETDVAGLSERSQIEDKLYRAVIPRIHNKGLVRLFLQFSAAEGRTSIQTETHHQEENLREIGRRIADFCTVPYLEE